MTRVIFDISASLVGAVVGSGRTGGSARTPTFIVSHSEPEEIPEGGVYTFVNSPEEALELARAAAGNKDVDIFSANVGQQPLRAGRVDEIHVHLVPVLFGAGTRLFENVGDDRIQLEITRVEEGPKATHLRYAVISSHRSSAGPIGAEAPKVPLEIACAVTAQPPIAS